MFAGMRLSEIYRHYLHELRALYPPNEAARITEMAFEFIAELQRADVIKDPAKVLPEPMSERLHEALKRLQQHEPIQHVIGEAWFCNLAFKVSPDVLIPRPETEELVHLASAFIKGNNLTVLDIGTGSGCIPIALKVKHANINVQAIDISEPALQIARANAERHQCQIDFIKNDFLEESNWPAFKPFDVIISNPPYIPEADKDLLDKNVTQFESHLALFEPVGQPCIFYKKITRFGKSHLLPHGKIFVEIHEDFGREVVDIFEKDGYTARLKKDMFGKERFVEAYTFKV